MILGPVTGRDRAAREAIVAEGQAARETGLEELWLEQGRPYATQAREAIDAVRWPR